MTISIIVSFVHNYNDPGINFSKEKHPALWVVKDEKKEVFSYPFPRNPDDFYLFKNHIRGEMPYPNVPTFKKLPRFGFTGLAQTKNYIFAGSWSSVYKIRKEDYSLKNIISHHLMSDTHGIWLDGNEIITILTCKDTVVISDHEGNIVDHFSVDRKLNVFKDSMIDEYDWRFISKQNRGSTGYWHFNYVQKIDNEIWLTSRNANSFVVVDLDKKSAVLRLMNFNTPVLLHDGIKHGNRFYFTSIDGKIIIAEDHKTTELKQHGRESDGNQYLYNIDLVTVPIRLSETDLGREPNWCRGIAVKDGVMYVTIDGRYDSDLSFGLLALREDNQEIIFNNRLRWSEIEDEKELRFVTGFDVLAV